MPKTLAQKTKELPAKPGVYIYKDDSGAVLYVGKAVNLRKRVASYFKSNARHEPRIARMVAQITDMEFTVTDNEHESLVLENNFIKQLKPKYNVLLRDDKNYLFIKINLQDQIPTITYERKFTDRRARYFGPYTSGMSIKETLRMLRRIFPYCANSKVGPRPCFYYHLQKCPGVCIGKITPEEYREQTIAKIIRFLQGRQSQVLLELQGQMKYLARHKQFESAAKIRDQIFALNRMMERQKIVYPSRVDQDVFAVHEEGVASVNLFVIRNGKLIQKENFILENTKQVPLSGILESFLERYYLETSSVPAEIVLPVKINDQNLQNILSRKRDTNETIGKFVSEVKISVPRSGKKADLLKLGQENAKQYLEAQSDKHLLEEARLMSALKELQRVLNLPALPGRIEAFDISNIQGTNAVGSMIVFNYGRPDKSQYRKFKIQRKQTPDDFAMMAEMLGRRFDRSKVEVGAKAWPRPDLILIDGGKGQLSAARAALRKSETRNSKSEIPMIGLAKRLEEIFLPLRSLPITLPPNSIALFLLQRIRDEAHRFAIAYHKKLRSKAAIKSSLDDIPGLGPAKKKKLLNRFGSAAKIKKASLTDIAAVVGSKLADKVKASL